MPTQKYRIDVLREVRELAGPLEIKALTFDCFNVSLWSIYEL